jgi:hypothetical protein
MVSNKSYIVSLIFLLLAFQIACGQCQSGENFRHNSKTDKRSQNAKRQAEEMFEIVIKKGNYNKIADYTPAQAFEFVGGREKYIEILTQTYKFTAEYFESLTWTIGEPQNLTEIDNDLFIVIPRTLNGISPQKTKVVQKGSMVGISIDKGKTWKFVNGKSFDKIFSSLDSKIQIPKEQTFIDGVEQ